MNSSHRSESDLRMTLLSWLLGFLGIAALFKLLPRTIKYLIRRWVFGLITEIVVVVIAGLLTEKAVDRLTGRPASPPSSDAPSSAPQTP